MERQRDYVLRTVEERGVRLIRLWFTDVLGQLKSFAISPAELENAFDEGMRFDGSAIDGFSRVQEIRRARPSRPEQLRAAALGRQLRHLGAHVLRHPQHRRLAVRGRSPARAAPQPRPGARARLQLLRRAGDGVLLLRRRRHQQRTQAARPGAATSTSPPPTWHRTCASARSTRSRRWASPSSTATTRTRPSQHEIDLRYTDAPDDGRQRDDLPAGGAGGGAGSRRARHLHAQAARRRAGLGDAHPLLALRGRHQLLLRRRRRAQPVQGGTRLHRRPAPPRPGDHRGHQPVGELLQAARHRLRGADLRRPGRATTARSS